jgi:hypothetical protein
MAPYGRQYDAEAGRAKIDQHLFHSVLQHIKRCLRVLVLQLQ